MNPIGILGTGSFLPSVVVSNEEIAEGAGVTAEWITRKTGIRERRRAEGHQATSDLAAVAAQRALDQAGIRAEEVAYIVLSTSTPDRPQPPTASFVQHLIGAVNAAAFDVNAVCSGFVYALSVAERMLRPEPEGRYALVIGADIYSRILDYSDRKTAVLFGDGAGAAVLGRTPASQGLLSTSLVSRGDQHGLIGVPAGGSRMPASAQTVASGSHYFRMDGRGVRAFVQENLPAAVHALLDSAGVRPEEVRHFVPHQANGVMLAEVWPELGLPNAEFHLTVERYANTGSASVPITLDHVHRGGSLAEGDMVLMVGFGGGMAIGSSLIRWSRTLNARPLSDVLRDRRPVPVAAAAD
ncbi:ketoacyl-ACP synthase III [Streptomyces sp. DSM 44917]|uniref:Ketoacyl-ACP synthase III n=1 Tax=Streptomyces boetiae TaxID=3075541 RepID=A0ABU2L556_9ACTN|nr:ketoacyl-ACP synthase III [Streptomyces sp. DSM 44917]MDT0306696.1 ketoacyl-ACP synthase III [Streptomyces sp. DSM 44917]